MRFTRRDLLRYATGLAALGLRPIATVLAGSQMKRGAIRSRPVAPPPTDPCGTVSYLPVPLERVPFPKVITFTGQYGSKTPVTLVGHYWYNADLLAAGTKMPAIVELNPYRRRDGMMYVDSMMYPWFALNGYLCFRVDLQGTGDSSGIITDEYTEEELVYCGQVIEQIAKLPLCDGNVGMMGKSWSAINALMMAARDDTPAALKAVIVCCGNDDRYNDDIHYMGGAMMQDNVGWPSAMWGWTPLPPDPLIVPDRWQQRWGERIDQMAFWFQQWAGHQTRDAYWQRASVRDHYAKVKVPVFILSGWQDGYKNPVDRAVRALGELGRPVGGLIGPWGHKYPFDGYPGPRIDWLRYITTHWWDRWLKGKTPDPVTTWPPLTVWMGESREPPTDREPHYVESGAWVAEDHHWMSRTRWRQFHLAADHRLSPRVPAVRQVYASRADITLGTSILETSSWGECTNDDLPGDQTADDQRAIAFTSAPLTADFACFGYPTVVLTMECDRPIASLDIRLSEVSPVTGRSHLVTYRFFNLAYRGGNMARPQPVRRGVFTVRIPLNITGHVFKSGWKIRLSVSPAFFPTMWQSPQVPMIRVHAGRAGTHPASALLLPGRRPRADDGRIQRLLAGSVTAYVNPEQYVPTLQTLRGETNSRVAQPIAARGRKGILVKKLFDSGSYIYGGALQNMLVDETASENFQILDGDPLSAVGFTHYETTLGRGEWKIKAVTDTRVWSERDPTGQVVFRYGATAQTFLNGKPFKNKRVTGRVIRRWI